MKNSKPILFSTEMVQAILAGRKTQTRRVCAHQYWTHSELTDVNVNEVYSKVDRSVSSKYQPGDILWVRETWCKMETASKIEDNGIRYKASIGKNNFTWKPSIFMPKEAARIFLKVTDVRVKRLQDISEADAMAEGVNFHWFDEKRNIKIQNAYSLFQELWDSINGKKHPWDSNPWVWVYTFERTDKPENFLS